MNFGFYKLSHIGWLRHSLIYLSQSYIKFNLCNNLLTTNTAIIINCMGRGGGGGAVSYPSYVQLMHASRTQRRRLSW